MNVHLVARWRVFVLLAALLLGFALPGAGQAPALTPLPTDNPTAVPAATPLPAEGPLPFDGWPPLDEEGYLLVDDQQTAKEFVHRDEENGRWLYVSPTLRVEIERLSAKYRRKTVVWFMADIRFRGEEHFRAFSADAKRPSRAQDRPENIAKNNKVVYAQNGDFFSFRLYNKERVGLIIRDGQILHEDTYTRPVAKIPPLDELALFKDGHVEMRTPGEVSGAEYLQRGALDVLAFGPILFKDKVKDERLGQRFTHAEPRSALGVVGPGHFVGIMVEGRNKRSAGVPLDFVADRLLEKGCYEAYTLDGGQTAAMIFMGKNVMTPGIYNGFQKARRQQDIVGIGTYQREEMP